MNNMRKLKLSLLLVAAYGVGWVLTGLMEHFYPDGDWRVPLVFFWAMYLYEGLKGRIK